MDLEALDLKVMQGLKNFQRATVERIDQLYRDKDHPQNRVLVADEVGLGKTLIARGAVVKMARLRQEEGDDCFKVVYICANQNIAGQNIHKLNVTGDAQIDNLSEARLSMQHLRITEAECSAAQNHQFIQLIPLTPDTSFRVTDGSGSVGERALIYSILKNIDWLQPYSDEFEKIMIDWAVKAWKNWARSYYAERVERCSRLTEGRYPANIVRQFEIKAESTGLKHELITKLQEARTTREYHQYSLVGKLRSLFAEISIDLLQPDFVIMDEFQRFRSLIGDEKQQSEATMLARRFLASPDTRVLLLSATPYKLYSTMEEIEADGTDDPYREFLQVTDFLFEKNGKQEFRQVWRDYSGALKVLQCGDKSILQIKQRAEKAMYQGICRTERISVMNSGDYLDDSASKAAIMISREDILSYLEAGKLMQRIGGTVPVDYVKSCPFLLSFMQEYELKKRFEKYFYQHPEEIGHAHSDMLWINKGDIEAYRELPETNARLHQLKEKAFRQNAELLLWVPPTIPYYPLDGVWKDSTNFSKILVFSAWEMVPRMIGSLISYESERRTVGKLRSDDHRIGKKERGYFSESGRRYPAPRLKLSTKQDIVQGKSLFCLMYPSKVLSELFDPLACINGQKTIADIKHLFAERLEPMLAALPSQADKDSQRADERWYYLSPMLLDGIEYVQQWIKNVRELIDQEHTDDKSERKENESLLSYISMLLDDLSTDHIAELGPKPDDLIDVLCEMVLGSPAVCAYRALRDVGYAGRVAKLFVNYFNTTEATAIVALSAKQDKENAHWRNVLRYCMDGCLQSMLDEYIQLLTEDAGLVSEATCKEFVFKTMQDALSLHSASYDFDTYSSLKNRVNDPDHQKDHKPSLRTGFAVGYIKGKGAEAKATSRRENIRNAFNSPMRPFVLTTTSIGQEGLDFHRYCRAVMHWNLPSNPIDLEQREGRVNRYKCLAIRQTIAEQCAGHVFSSNIWEEAFATANSEKHSDSDLIPFWCAGEKQSVKIERIVPMYPLSQDQNRYERLIKILSLYRLTLGQARQEELLDYILSQNADERDMKQLFFDLSPFSKNNNGQT